MRLRNIKNAKDIIKNSEYVVKNLEFYKGKWQTVFNNDNLIHLEIGCGKGTFIHEMAKKYPNINFIGIEKYESILVRALEKINEEPLPNLRFICANAENLNEYFNKEISCIYLNFSDPWPKKRHARRRLTSPIFLNIYDSLFIKENLIIQKTDNIGLFASSIKELNNFGYTFLDVDLDYNSEDNICTEYETKFRNLGVKINYLKAIKKC